jgi:DNA helicase-2/ATP-dependent DNA helicase PcrA
VSFLKDLNPAQQDAVRAVNGPVMIIAGAGSGKTRVLTYRIAHLLASGVPPSSVLALTFTNKAAGEMKTRIQRLVGDKAADLWMGTFHSVFARILRRESQMIGYTNSYTIYDTDDSLAAVKAAMERLKLSTQQFNPSGIRSRISYAKNQMLTPAQAEERSASILDEHASRVYAEYDKALRRCNAMDFDDLLLKPIELFERFPKVLEKYQHRFSFVHVDEFQDTNRAQYRVMRLLGERNRNVCVVGDDAQSIYSFRGAEIRNILDFSKDYPDCQTFRLEQNYRSTKSIIGAADQLIRQNTNRLKKHLWTDNPVGEPVTVVQCADDQDEALRVVHLVQEEVGRRKGDLRDIAVLYRTNAQSRAIEDALRRTGIPYVIVGGIRFYERKEIKDVLGYLRILVNPLDDASLLRIINTPVRGIGDTTVDRLRAFASVRSISLHEALGRAGEIEELNERARLNLRQFRALLDKYRQLRETLSLSEWPRALVDELGFLTGFKEERTPDSMARWENVQELLSAITEFSQQGSAATLEAFLEEVSLVSDIDRWEGTANAVTLMTLHASKGLEFPVVCVTGLEEGLLPFTSAGFNDVDVEEERRLLYVGMTRAERRLYLMHAQMRYRFGEASIQTPSRFLAELGSEHVQHVGLRVPQTPTLVPTMRRMSAPVRRPSEPSSDHHLAGDRMPDYEAESQEALVLKKGMMVRHEVFGRGKVVDLSGSGENRKAVVDFDKAGLKSLILKFARLQKG